MVMCVVVGDEVRGGYWCWLAGCGRGGEGEAGTESLARSLSLSFLLLCMFSRQDKS